MNIQVKYTPLLQLECNPQRNEFGSFEYEWMWRYIAFLYQMILSSLKIYLMTLSPVPCPLPFGDLEIIVCVCI